jgi:hypothetical protein
MGRSDHVVQENLGKAIAFKSFPPVGTFRASVKQRIAGLQAYGEVAVRSFNPGWLRLPLFDSQAQADADFAGRPILVPRHRVTPLVDAEIGVGRE